MPPKSPPFWLSIFGLSSVLVIIISVIIIFTVKTSSPQPPVTVTSNSCIIAGCARNICQSASEPLPSTDCPDSTPLACQQYAKCEILATGHCGWSYTQEFITCLKSLPNPSL